MNTADPDPPPGAAADWTIDQDWAAYTPDEHALWVRLYERQMEVLAGRADQAFFDGLDRLDLHGSGVPEFTRLNEALAAATGWRIVAVPGLVPDAVFFAHLAARRFPAGRFLRRPDQMDYIAEPDVFHDVFGHAPMLADPVFADYLQAYGQGGLRALSLGVLPHLARLYWYTVEFGLIRRPEGLRLYGAGIVSSASESVYALESARPKRRAFELERTLRTLYTIDSVQETYFVIDSYDQLFEATLQDFAPIYERVRDAPTFAANA
jgi:phenylalanine-4-hydroxylase